MRLLEVMPIAKGVGKEILTYWSAKEIQRGAIIRVSLRSRVVPALVVSSKGLKEQRASVRSAAFGLKKAGKIISNNFFSRAALLAAAKTADYFAAPMGGILREILPEDLIRKSESAEGMDGDENGENRPSSPAAENQKEKGTRIAPERLVFEAGFEERNLEWKTTIATSFAKGQSVIFCYPNTIACGRAFEKLRREPEDRFFIFHSARNGKALRADWRKALRSKLPIAVFATPSFMTMPRADIGVIVLEGENSPAYKSPFRPFLDFRTFAEIYAREIGAKIILADYPLRTETWNRFETGEIDKFRPGGFSRFDFPAARIIDATKIREGRYGTKRTISSELLALVKEIISEKKRIFILAARRGFAGTTICRDCQKTVSCERCGAPLVLHESDKEPIFLCHRCGRRQDTKVVCKNCGGWRLLPLGIGIEKVAAELEEEFPGVKIIRFASDTLKSPAAAAKAAEEFNDARGAGVMVGTEMALTYLEKPLAAAAVASIDSLLALPGFRINEKIFSMLSTLRQLSRRSLLIQTRDPENPVLLLFRDGNLKGFRKSELADRERFNLPPFRTLIKLSVAGTKAAALMVMEKIEKLLQPQKLEIYQNGFGRTKSQIVLNGLLTLKPESWPDETLLKKLRSLSPAVAVKVDPESIF